MSMSRLITGSCVVNWEKLQKSPPLQMCPRASNILWILANYLTWRDYSHFPLCYYSHSAQGLAGRRFLNESKWKCQPIIAPPAERNCSQCWKLRQQFAAVSCFSRSLCRALLQFNWIGSEPEEDKTNKVTSRYSLTLWSQVGNLTTASIGIDTTLTQFQTTNVDDLVQLTFCFLLSVTFQSLLKHCMPGRYFSILPE